MRALLSIVLLIQVNNLVVFGVNNEVTWAKCSNSTDLVFVCGKNDEAAAGNVENSKRIERVVPNQGAETSVPSFEKFKVENQLAENTKLEHSGTEGEQLNAENHQGNDENLQETPVMYKRFKRSPDGEENVPENPAAEQPAQSNVSVAETQPVDQNVEAQAPKVAEPSEKTVESAGENPENKKEVTETTNVAPQIAVTEAPKDTQADQPSEPQATQSSENKQPSEAEAVKVRNVEEKPVQPVSESKIDAKTEVREENKTEAAAAAAPVEAKSAEQIENSSASAKPDDSITLEKCVIDGKSTESRPKKSFTSISYHDCQFVRLPAAFNAFSAYENLKLFNISHVGLEQFDEIQGASVLETILASHNNLTEIAAGLFTHSAALTTLDLSNNRLNRIDPQAFADLSNLKYLNLSWNNLSSVNSSIFEKLVNLEHLDLSHNQFTSIDNKLFEHLMNLKVLNLSHNSIENVDLFITTAIEHLDLSNLKLAAFETAVFSSLPDLKSLNLANNKLKKINFEPFSALKKLLKFNLNGNQLTDLNGFVRSFFPTLDTFGIADNAFNCSYLETFFNSTDLKSVDLTNGVTVQGDQNVHGVSCKTSTVSIEEYLEQKVHNIMQHIDGKMTTMKASISLLCVAMVVLIVFIIVLRRKVHKATGRSAIYELTVGPDGRKEGKAVICT